MAITRIKNSSINNKTPKYNDVLAGLPFRPIIGTATDGGNGTSVSVAFTGNNVANGTITYTALSSPGSFTGTGTISPITVSGLTAGTAYTFQVKAGNSLGDSAYSAASNSVTPVTPTSFESIATVTLATDTATVTFSSIPSTYNSIQVRYLARSTDAVTYTNMNISPNGSGAVTNHNILGNGSTVTATGATANAAIYLYDVLTGANASANVFSVGIIDVIDYSSTTKNKTFRMFAGQDQNSSFGNIILASSLATSLGTSALTSLVFSNSANFKSGSTFALYGIKG